MKSRKHLAAGAALLIMGIVLGMHFNGRRPFSPSERAAAAGGKVTSPTGTAPERYVYYPGTEELGKEEIRLICCGSGMPASRRGQAATCWLVELGNGDKFLFDVGSGAMANVAALMIPYEYLDKVFLTHLHTDHWGDLDALWAGGWTAGRPNPLQVWGPSGATPEMGTKYAVEHMLKANHWDYQTRAFKISPVPGRIDVHEFDYKAENEIVYEKGGAKVRSWPAIHAGDGPVSYSLDYAGLKVVIGGDTYPNEWFLEYGKDADVCVHEAMNTPEQLHQLYNQAPRLALAMNTEFHTSGQAFGDMMTRIKPRHAIAYHFLNEEATRYGVYSTIRETYGGPLSMATDMMVWTITKDAVKERMAVSPDEAWSVPGTAVQPGPEPGRPDPMTDHIKEGRLDMDKTNANLVEEFSKKYGLKKPEE